MGLRLGASDALVRPSGKGRADTWRGTGAVFAWLGLTGVPWGSKGQKPPGAWGAAGTHVDDVFDVAKAAGSAAGLGQGERNERFERWEGSFGVAD